MAVAAAGTTVRVTRVVAAPRERVFEAWTDPELFRRWFTPFAGDAPSAELDVREGGTFRVRMRIKPLAPLARSPLWCVGRYVEVTPPERLVFTFGWEGPLERIEEGLVTVDFADLGGRTEITIVHERNQNAAVRGFHNFGWWLTTRRLARLLAP